MTTLTLTAEVASQYAATLGRFQEELMTRWKASAREAHQALYLMLLPTPYGPLRIVLGEHTSAVARIAEKAGITVLPVNAAGEMGLALPPLTGAIREAWPGPVLF